MEQPTSIVAERLVASVLGDMINENGTLKMHDICCCVGCPPEEPIPMPICVWCDIIF